MNVNSSSNGTSAVMNANNSSATSKTSSSKGSSSFEEELKGAAANEEALEETKTPEAEAIKEKEDSSEVKNNDKTNADLKGQIEQNEVIDSEDILTKNIQAILKTNKEMSMALNPYRRQDLGNVTELYGSLSAKINYTSIQMDENDALFFSNLVQNTDMSMQSVASEIKNLAEATSIQQAQKTANVSATLFSALHEAAKTNQPLRIDFDKDISVIIKINKDGSIAANFIPGDKAVEEYLKMNMSSLKQRFDQENISYSDLTYSRAKQQQQEENNKRKNKENGHE